MLVLLWYKVMAISVASTEGRIIQTHWNGEQLVIYMSPLYYLKAKEMTAYDLFVRYMASDPLGNTKSIPLDKHKREKQINSFIFTFIFIIFIHLF